MIRNEIYVEIVASVSMHTRSLFCMFSMRDCISIHSVIFKDETKTKQTCFTGNFFFVVHVVYFLWTVGWVLNLHYFCLIYIQLCFKVH